MSTGVDLSQFYEMFFDEAEELLSDMEGLLLGLDVDDPSMDDLNGIFRAAHSIKGGAGTFGCFQHLANTTHILENVLDSIRKGELTLRQEMIDVFLEAKDVLTEQLAAYRNEDQPDEETYNRICEQLKQIAVEQKDSGSSVGNEPTPEQAINDTQPAKDIKPSSEGEQVLHITITDIKSEDAKAIEEEMAIMGTVVDRAATDNSLDLWVSTSATASDIEAVCCFIVNLNQLKVAPVGSAQSDATTVADANIDAEQNQPEAASPDNNDTETKANEPAAKQQETAGSNGANGSDKGGSDKKPRSGGSSSQVAPVSSTLRVGVEKIDQIINLVGELVITQAMLVQTVANMDPVLHDRLVNGVEQLERNARDLQEAVMSIRMMPMDYVFSRFPRVVRESASAMNKKIKLVTLGQATELDKSLIERIIDPLTHLVRNSIDHGIEAPDARVKKGKDPEGVLTLSAEHSGGHIVIQVRDDGAGLNRDKILEKAMKSGFPVDESTPDDELWQLIFAPGFSTAEKVTAISGRGVGMDVVRRNIQGMGGHIHLSSAVDKGTITRIVLPLTLAILDGMSVQVGEETFILPLSHVQESMQPTAEQIRSISETEKVLHVRGEYLPLIALHDVFSVDKAETDPTKAIAVILKAEELRFALLVDHLVGQHQVVVKNLESNYRKIPGISAATILGDGSVALIVDVFAVMRLTHKKSV